MKVLNIIFAVVLLVLVHNVYEAKLNYKDMVEFKDSLNVKISKVQSSIVTLGAEWEYLNNPTRLIKLASIYQDKLNLVPIKPNQMVASGDLQPKEFEKEDIRSFSFVMYNSLSKPVEQSVASMNFLHTQHAVTVAESNENISIALVNKDDITR